MKWSRLTINLDPITADAAKEIAKKQRRSFAAYVATLIERDMAGQGQTLEEERDKYHAERSTQKEKPPDSSGRTTGVGPRHRVQRSA